MIEFPTLVDPRHVPFVCLRPEGFDLSIPADGGGKFLDLMQHVIGDYSSTGRTRSVFGGLWTDRLDASALLAGRVAVGSVATELQSTLSELIARGYVCLQGAMGSRPVGERELEVAALIAAALRDGERVIPESRSALSGLAGMLFTEPLVRLLRAMFDDHAVAYRADVLRDGGLGFAQACSVEALPSPAECALAYLCPAPGVRIEVVRDSHELPEFAREDGHSRWTAEGAAAVGKLVREQASSIEVTELERLDTLLVGPGIVHRVVPRDTAPVLRVLLAPRRVTPLKFLSGETAWLEGTHVSGARLRL